MVRFKGMYKDRRFPPWISVKMLDCSASLKRSTRESWGTEHGFGVSCLGHSALWCLCEPGRTFGPQLQLCCCGCHICSWLCLFLSVVGSAIALSALPFVRDLPSWHIWMKKFLHVKKIGDRPWSFILCSRALKPYLHVIWLIRGPWWDLSEISVLKKQFRHSWHENWSAFRRSCTSTVYYYVSVSLRLWWQRNLWVAS